MYILFSLYNNFARDLDFSEIEFKVIRAMSGKEFKRLNNSPCKFGFEPLEFGQSII